MKPQDIEEIAAGVQPAIYSDDQTKVFAFNLRDLNLFARGVLNAAGKRLVEAVNNGEASQAEVGVGMEIIKTLRDE